MSAPDFKQDLDRRLGRIQRELRKRSASDRKKLIEQLVSDFFIDARGTLRKWGEITGQSAQVDAGYIAQHLASLVLQTPGGGYRGKGVDLRDGSEVKSASIIDGRDRPRWNHNLGTLAQDAKRQREKKPTAGEVYLNQTPWIFYVLFDRIWEEPASGDPNLAEPTDELRIRAWCVEASRDKEWRKLVKAFLVSRTASKYNLQLHPPIGYDDGRVANELGNLEMDDTLAVEIRFRVPSEDDEELDFDWPVARLDPRSRSGRKCRGLPYKRVPDRPSRLERWTLSDGGLVPP